MTRERAERVIAKLRDLGLVDDVVALVPERNGGKAEVVDVGDRRDEGDQQQREPGVAIEAWRRRNIDGDRGSTRAAISAGGSHARELNTVTRRRRLMDSSRRGFDADDVSRMVRLLETEGPDS